MDDPTLGEIAGASRRAFSAKHSTRGQVFVGGTDGRMLTIFHVLILMATKNCCFTTYGCVIPNPTKERHVIFLWNTINSIKLFGPGSKVKIRQVISV